MKIKVCVAGATGAVGKALVKAIIQSEDLKLVGAVSRSNAGSNLGQLIGNDNLNLIVSGSVKEALKTDTDVLVDYTSAAVIKKNILCALNTGVNVVVGSSGLTENDFSEIEKVAKNKSLCVFAAGNFAITAVLMQYLATIAARHVPNWEIIDYGKAEKIDAPSGTSRETAHKLAQIRKPSLDLPIENTTGNQEARGASIKGSQVHSLRLPGFISSAEIIFGLPGERLSIRHDSVDSGQPYVSGTLLAIRNVQSKIGLTRGLEQLMNIS